MNNSITNEEFKKLFNMNKYFVNKKNILPSINEEKKYDIISENRKDKFILDTSRKGTYSLHKVKLQKRYATTISLIRLEIDAPPHVNPDGKKISRDHIHIYKEGYGLAYAYDLESIKQINLNLEDLSDFNKIFIEFCKFCNINIDNRVELQGVLT
ncbi:DUF6978 family protein [Anaerofustis stercorihominis]|uniref:DUF6978 family protein n=1 Tax=Anaerofustis stercorihominis TaxID=214853 RepID=UPI00267256FA|nr:hypothetical protein [Anaerofustis stercorihominis]